MTTRQHLTSGNPVSIHERYIESLELPLQKRTSTSTYGISHPESSNDELDPESTPAFLPRRPQESAKDNNAETWYGGRGKISTYVDQIRRLFATMSKSALLMRSPPGLGVGSYGAAPLAVSTDNSEEEEDIDDVRRRTRRKQKASGLRYTVSASTAQTRRCSNDEGSSSSQQGIRMRASTSRLRRKSLSGPSPVPACPNGQDLGLETRYGAGGLPIPADVVLVQSQNNKEDSTASDRSSEATNSDDGSTNDEEDPPDNSPYPQVRASVSAIDNITLSINTPRMWTLSLFFAILGSSTNLFFSLRYPAVAITPVIALLLVQPLGLLWDQLLKRHDDPEESFVDGVLDREFSGSTHTYNGPSSPTFNAPDGVDGQNESASLPVKGSPLSSLRLWLAQGRWNEKEHACVYISSNVSFGFAFATDVIVEQTQFYKQEVGIIYQLLLILSTQILGYAFAGLTRRFLVRPAGMIWPGTLMSAAMFTTLHKEENTIANGWRMTRWKFFFVVWTSAFLFYFLPGLLMPALSYFSVITWFAPKNVVVANLFGVASGLGLFPVTFDWAQIAYIGSPLLTPFWAAMNVVAGLVIVMWIIAPIAYYKNLFFSSYMPILSAAVFDNTGHVYDVSKILTPEFLFDRKAYQNYSQVFLPITYVLSYGLQFAALSSLLSHTVCWYGKDIWKQWRKSLKEIEGESKGAYESLGSSAHLPPDRPTHINNDSRYLHRTDSNVTNIISQEDVHNRLMKRYQDAPLTWYLITFVSMTAVGIFVVEYYPVHLPWYGLLLSLAICALLFIPIAIVMAITNQHSSIYLICQLVCGVLFPGRPVANMVFVTYGYISSAQGVKFSADLKLGHYMKIPPRILFSVQITATIVSSITQIAVLNWMFAYIPNICTPQALNGFSCPIARVHFNGSILWGVVGPTEFFGPNATYHVLVWCFLIGAIGPIPLWLYGRNRKNSIIRKINLPVLFGSLSWIPPATGLNFSVWALVCYIFNYIIKRRASAWWAKYTMTLSAALDSGLAFGLVVVFFGFVYPGWMEGFKWWGTEIYKQGCDWQACPYKTLPPGEHFGPDKW